MKTVKIKAKKVLKFEEDFDENGNSKGIAEREVNEPSKPIQWEKVQSLQFDGKQYVITYKD